MPHTGTQRARHVTVDLASLVQLDAVPTLELPLPGSAAARTTSSKHVKSTRTKPAAARTYTPLQEASEEEVLVYDKNMYRDEDDGSSSCSSSNDDVDETTQSTSDGMTRSSHNSSITQAHAVPEQPRHASPRTSHTASPAVSARRLFTSLCTCYWAAFGEAEMSIVPDAHAAHCPCRWQGSEYDMRRDEIRIEHGEDSERDTIDLSSDTKSSNSNSCSSGVVDVRRNRKAAHRASGTTRSHNAERHKKKEKRKKRRTHGAVPAASPRVHLDASLLHMPLTSARKGSAAQKAARRGISIGRAARMPAVKSCSPGPGAYEVARAACEASALPASEAAPRAVRGVFVSRSARSLPYDTTSKANATRAVSPGPASYDVGRAFQAEARHVSPPAYHFPRAARLTSGAAPYAQPTHDEPGPASYDVQAVTDMAAAIIRAGSRRKGRTQSVTHGAAASRETRLAVSDNGVPGPGTYDLTQRQPSAPRITRGRHANAHGNSDDDDDVVLRRSTGRTTFGTAERAVGSAAAPCALPQDMKRSTTPGPGAYDVARAALHEARTTRAPQWTMPTSGRTKGGAQREEEEAARMPGPGQYLPIFAQASLPHSADDAEGEAREERKGATSSARRCVRGTFGTASRGLLPETSSTLHSLTMNTDDDDDDEGYYSACTAERDASPGPGAYDVARAASADAARRGARMQTAPRRTWIEQLTRAPQAQPGPASYDVKYSLVTQRTAGPVMGPAGTCVGEEQGTGVALYGAAGEGPGPGAYDLPSSATHPRSAVIGTAARGLRWTQRGGAAALYAGGSASDEEAAGGEVGPGSYALPALPRGAAFTMAGKPTTRGVLEGGAEDERPGPGAYSPQLSLVRPQAARAVLRSTSPRFADDSSNNTHSGREGYGREVMPGPGAYDTQNERSVSAGPSFPTAARLTWPQSEMAAAQGGLSSVSEAWKANVGPGSYEVERAMSASARGGAIPHAARFADNTDERQGPGAACVPGPGAYDVAAAESRALRVPAVSFPTAPRDLYTDAFTSGSSNNAGGGAGGVPGPGAYDPQLQLRYPSARAVSIAHKTPTEASLRASEAMKMPGPGAYDVRNDASQHASAPRYGFGSAPRVTLTPEVSSALAAQTPGPGAYELQASSSGAINHPGGASGAAARFATAPRVYSHIPPSDTPGPGSYNLQAMSGAAAADTTQCTSTAHAVRFATAPRVLYMDTTTTTNNNSSAADGVRGAVSASPGPGAYDPQLQLVLPRAPQPSRFGTQARATGVDAAGTAHEGGSATPGPGAYNTALDTLSLPGYRGVHLGTASQTTRRAATTLPTSLVEGSSNFTSDGDGPGPGAYSPDHTTQQPRAPALAFPTAPRMTSVNMSADSHNNNVGRGDATPGPGAYDVQDALSSVHRAVSLGTSARFASTPLSHEAAGAASSKTYTTPMHAPGYSFGRADRGLVSDSAAAAEAAGADHTAVWPSRTTATRVMSRTEHQEQQVQQQQVQQRIDVHTTHAGDMPAAAPVRAACVAAGPAGRPEKHVRFLLHDTPSERSGRRAASPRVTRDVSPGPGSYDLRTEQERRGVRQPTQRVDEANIRARHTQELQQQQQKPRAVYTTAGAMQREEQPHAAPRRVVPRDEQRNSMHGHAALTEYERDYVPAAQQEYSTAYSVHATPPQQRDARTLERLIQAGYPISGQRQAEAALIDAMPR